MPKNLTGSGNYPYKPGPEEWVQRHIGNRKNYNNHAIFFTVFFTYLILVH